METASPAKRLELSRLVESAVLRGKSSAETHVLMSSPFKTQHSKAQTLRLVWSDILRSTSACSADKDMPRITQYRLHALLDDFYYSLR